MKTLNESISEVMNNGKSLNTKRTELIKLGLRPTDVYNIIYVYKQQHPEECAPRPRVVAFAYKFGVEIENFCNRQKVERSLRESNVPFTWQGTYYHTNGNSRFEFKHDGSLRCDSNTDAENRPIEMVSPVFNNGRNDFEMLKKACKALEDNGAQVNKSTGLHVHISSPAITDTAYVNVFKNYQKLENVINTFMARSRHDNDYAAKISNYDFSCCSTPRDVERLMHSRYHKVNPCSWSSHRTIEFRQHGGTCNYTKISEWVKFCAALVGWSVNNVLDHEVTSIDEIPFLNAKQKAFFKSRAAEFAARAAA